MKKILPKIVCAVTVIAILIVTFIQPIRQNQGYHNFADQILQCCIPNFWNVISNLPFIIIGIIGLWKTSKYFQDLQKAILLMKDLGFLLQIRIDQALKIV